MIIINKPIETIIKMLGKQEIKNDEYRTLTYVQTLSCDDGLLIYNLLTRELILLKDAERIAFEAFDISNPTIKYMIENWFIVSKQLDDYKVFKQTDTIFRLLCDSVKSPLTQFTILPTTDCNARCFYCFELNRRRIDMTKEVAADVGGFIVKKSNGQKVHITWFGGEPLYNQQAIDTILQILINNNIDYSSDMISNAYLFDKDLIYKAVEVWKLKKIQITLDGTEEVYNKCKAYIYKDDQSPFIRVINNIEELLKAGVFVNIRLNVDMHNYLDLENLVIQLKERFKGNKNLMIYFALLYENGVVADTKRSADNKKLLLEKIAELKKIISSNDYTRKKLLKTYRQTKHCIADNNNTVLILPDGHLGKCEYYTEDNYYGSIYSENVDMTYINKFKEVKEISDKCHKCPMQPKCYPLVHCPHTVDYCDDYDRILKIEDLKNRMLAEFEIFKNGVPVKDSEFIENC